MAASYPSSVKSFTALNTGDVIEDTHPEAAYDEITAIENALLSTGLAHVLIPDATANNRDLGSTAKKWRDLHLAGDVNAAGEVLAGDGAVGAPGFAFGSDTDTGVYRSGANALDVATAGVKALGIDSTQFIDSPTQPRCVTWMSGVQSVSRATTTALTFNTDDIDVGSLHDVASNTSRITIPTGGDGLYYFEAAAVFPALSNAFYRVLLRKNGTTLVGTNNEGRTHGTATQEVKRITALLSLVATDYIEALVYWDDGASGALNFGSGGDRQLCSQFSAVKLW